MNDDMIRIFCALDGTIHAGFLNKETVACTAGVMTALLTDPFSFYQDRLPFLKKTTFQTNPNHCALAKIPGMTLAAVQQDRSIRITFSECLQVLFDALCCGDMDTPLKLDCIAAQSPITDEKQVYLHMFRLLSAQSLSLGESVQRLAMPEEQRALLLCELVGSLLGGAPGASAVLPVMEPADAIGDRQKDRTEDDRFMQTTAPPNYIPLSEYAAQRNVNATTVRTWIQREKITQFVKLPNGHYMVDPAEEPARKKREAKVRSADGRRRITLKGHSYADVQLFIEERRLFSDELRPFIRTYEEAKYYEKNHYHEVVVNGRSALVLDINPEYYCKAKQKTNRQIILSGGSPVVPGDEDSIYHLHHIGQKTDSPFATIPQRDHNGTELYSVFHGGANDPDLHGKEFEEQKRSFWKAYLELYDAYGGFFKIPHKTAERRKAG